MTVAVGSLCSGIGGLELGLTLAGIDHRLEFVSDIDAGANAWQAANNATVRNLGDFTQRETLPTVDLVVAGFPCQPVSTAGHRAGLNDERWLFDDIADLIGRMEPRPDLFIENVPGLLTANDGHAMARIVHSMAGLGYLFTWGTLAASALGAPHGRSRWWGLARPTSPDADRVAAWRDGGTTPSAKKPDDRRSDPNVGHRSTYGTRARARFGKYADAVHRWETILNRPAPDPLDDGRLNAHFVEWMMGYPAGWVTDTLTGRTRALHALGNAVVPQCAAAAYTALVPRLDEWTEPNL